MILIPDTVWAPRLHSIHVCCLFRGKPRGMLWKSPQIVYPLAAGWAGWLSCGSGCTLAAPWLASACCPYNAVAAVADLGSCNTSTSTVLEHPRAFTQEPQSSILPDWPRGRNNGISRKWTCQWNQVNLGKSLRSDARKSVTYLDADAWNNSTPTDFQREVVYLRLS